MLVTCSLRALKLDVINALAFGYVPKEHTERTAMRLDRGAAAAPNRARSTDAPIWCGSATRCTEALRRRGGSEGSRRARYVCVAG